MRTGQSVTACTTRCQTAELSLRHTAEHDRLVPRQPKSGGKRRSKRKNADLSREKKEARRIGDIAGQIADLRTWRTNVGMPTCQTERASTLVFFPTQEMRDPSHFGIFKMKVGPRVAERSVGRPISPLLEDRSPIKQLSPQSLSPGISSPTAFARRSCEDVPHAR